MKNHQCLSAATLLFLSINCFAGGFVATEAEFASWDERCKALYISVDGKETDFARRLPHGVVWNYRRAEDEEGGGAWHYCIGLAWLYRSKLETDPASKRNLVKNAINEISYTRRNETGLTMDYINATVYLALSYREVGDPQSAIKLLKELLSQADNHSPAYTALYLAYRDTGQKDEALKTLQQAENNITPINAELAYFLGLEYINRNDIEKAKKYSGIAKQLGYPLTGLHQKIKEAEALSKK